jgi:heme-degrading monooxygenase HmoA
LRESTDTVDPAGAVVTVFRSRLRPEAVEQYEPLSDRMVALAQTMPGLLDYKTFAADDGERVTIVIFASMEEHRAWRDHPEHRQAQRLGRQDLYESYSIQVCTCLNENRFAR